MGEKILSVEDEPALHTLLRALLEEGGFTVVQARDGEEGLRQFYQHRPDLVMVDLMMPKMDGYELTRRIREMAATPIIVVSALGQEIDKVQALEAGADDYITKPFGRTELIARIRAAIRRSKLPPAPAPVQTYADTEVRIDWARHEVTVRDKSVELTPIQFRLLTTFVTHPGQALTQDQLVDQVWGTDADTLDSVKWHVGHLRRKIERDPNSPHLILTVRGVGYKYHKP